MAGEYMIKCRGTVVAFPCMEYLLIYCEMLRGGAVVASQVNKKIAAALQNTGSCSMLGYC